MSTDSRFQDDRPNVKFNYVGGDDNGEVYLELKYKQPSVAVKTEGNFATHDVLGDVTVRQKLGESPDEISIEGLCTAEEATKVDKLIYEEVVEIISNRWSGVVQIASTSTSPISEGGGMDKDAEWIYSLTIEAVEITEDMDEGQEFDPEDYMNFGIGVDRDGDGFPDII